MLQDVFLAIVPGLVRQDGDELRNRVRPDQGVEERDAPVPAEADEEGVALGAAPGAVHDEDVFQRKSDRAGVAQDGRAQLARLERRERVEERQDDARRQELNADHEGNRQRPAAQPGPRPGMLEERQNAGQKRRSDQDGEDQGFEPVRQKDPQPRAVEPEALLDHEYAVGLKGNGEGGAHGQKNAHVDQARHDRPGVQGTRPFVQSAEASPKPEDKGHRQEKN